jgi:hypothetical protein
LEQSRLRSLQHEVVVDQDPKVGTPGPSRDPGQVLPEVDLGQAVQYPAARLQPDPAPGRCQ